MTGRTLFVYVDESGNFDFSPSGTKHLVMSAFVTSDPVRSAQRLAKLKYELMADGVNVSSFHASEDRQRVRDKVLVQISLLEDVSSHTFWIRKDDLNSEVTDTGSLYEMFGQAIAQAAIAEVSRRGLDCVVVIFDKALRSRDERAFLSRAKDLFSRYKRPFHIYFHNVSQDFNGQIADYIAWSHYVALERNEIRPLTVLPRPLVGNSASLVAFRSLDG